MYLLFLFSFPFWRALPIPNGALFQLAHMLPIPRFTLPSGKEDFSLPLLFPFTYLNFPFLFPPNEPCQFDFFLTSVPISPLPFLRQSH